MPRSLGLLLVACSFGLAVLWLQRPSLTPTSDRVAGINQPTRLPAPFVLHSRAFGWRNLLADWLWLQYVQYFGDVAARKKSGYGLSAEYIQAITALDPAFIFAATQANYAVAEQMGAPKEAIAILTAAAKRNPGRADALGMPGSWYLWRLAGSVAFRHLGHYRQAAAYFERAAREPGAPAVMRDNAAAFYNASNDRERAIQLWREFYVSAPTAQLRAEGRRRLAALGVEVP
ncbi:hypothetical protein [Gloeobacter kilaueensis]|uniref:Tetratricopeptide repeat protein n=1 Tax=Gloeobacter kilaueensis (strain ATCC BAA-2537 / CCAP 1431/1 / ULC 316 / JS1) TaxID=1183438 RepID=U5QFG5_GLOK1|nr:hypothetical protein [Gloeobacter kilaueensis]AGY56329.1 hypothetical protein GKIL_0082 [Gloeobacter kilaueensis JS1]